MRASRPTILLVDDSESDLFLFEAALEMSGLEAELVTLRSAEQAVDYLAQGHRPDYFLLDLNMPGRDGFYVLENLHAPDVSLIVLTSSDSALDRERALALGATDFLTKPLSLHELTTLITDLMAAS